MGAATNTLVFEDDLVVFGCEFDALGILVDLVGNNPVDAALGRDIAGGVADHVVECGKPEITVAVFDDGPIREGVGPDRRSTE